MLRAVLIAPLLVAPLLGLILTFQLCPSSRSATPLTLTKLRIRPSLGRLSAPGWVAHLISGWRSPAPSWRGASSLGSEPHGPQPAAERGTTALRPGKLFLARKFTRLARRLFGLDEKEFEEWVKPAQMLPWKKLKRELDKTRRPIREGLSARCSRPTD